MLSLTMFASLCLLLSLVLKLYLNYRSKFLDILQRVAQKKDPFHKWRI